MEVLCSICCCNLIDPKQEIGLPFTSSGSNKCNQAYSTLCGHVFHYACLNQWVNQKRSKNCPECRAEINGEEDIHKVFFNVSSKSDDELQQDTDDEKLQMKKRTETLTKYIKHITKELGHVELKFDKLKDEIQRKDQEINDLKNLLNQERLCVPLRRQILKQ
jgi:peptidoglycan hydrolase CwlO-like protein